MAHAVADMRTVFQHAGHARFKHPCLHAQKALDKRLTRLHSRNCGISDSQHFALLACQCLFSQRRNRRIGILAQRHVIESNAGRRVKYHERARTETHRLAVRRHRNLCRALLARHALDIALQPRFQLQRVRHRRTRKLQIHLHGGQPRGRLVPRTHVGCHGHIRKHRQHGVVAVAI